LDKKKSRGRRFLTPALLPALIAAVVVAVLGIYVDHQSRALTQQNARASVLAKVNLIRTRLEGNINGNVQLVRGFVAIVSAEPDMSQTRFAQLSSRLLGTRSQLRNIAGAPDMVIRMMYPMEGNERALGLNYLAEPAQREAALRARQTGQLILAGPLHLRQGGLGLVARIPVFKADDGAFWGLVSAVLDVEQLYRDSGLYDDSGIDIALLGSDAQGAGGAIFYGDPAILSKSPVTATVMLPSGTWQIAATPSGGWGDQQAGSWLLRALILVAGVLVVIPMAVAGMLHDDRRASFEALADSESELRHLSQRLAVALSASNIGVWELDLDTGEVIWDERLCRLYGRGDKDMPHTYGEWAACIHPDDLDHAERDFRVAVESGTAYSSNYRIIGADGEIRHIRTHAAKWQDVDGRRKMIGAEWDRSKDVHLNEELEKAKVLAEVRSEEIAEAKARIEHDSLHDALTGLPNRRYLDETLERTALDAARRQQQSVALLHIDLDRFKQINDTLGHAAGDAMLIHAATVLRESVREDDFVARIGGDEFVVMCLADTGRDRLSALAQRIIRSMRKPVAYESHQCRFGVSIGIAVGSGGAVDTRQLLINADIALYRAKNHGRNRHEFFTEALQSAVVRTKVLADEILAGLERNEFEAFYQAQYDARTLEVSGVEALVRWRHPRKGLLPPSAFLETAEELNVVATIDRLVLEQALSAHARWTASGLVVPHISVNVSARRLRDEELIAGLRRLDIPKGVLSFELLESIFLDETDDAIVWNVDRLKELGIDIEIDDFGTGYASVVSLMKLQPHRLKIDRQLVEPVVRSHTQRRLVESIIEIGHTLGIEVVAEGVETMEHVRILQQIGCDKLQGYVFGRPMSAEDIEAGLREHRLRLPGPAAASPAKDLSLAATFG
jgi:diguanylate cyclase (GGDEF)-like protein